MITFPNAKINLGLNIVEKRPDGYHNLETIFYPISIEDVLEISELKDSDKEFELHISGRKIESKDEDNLVVKAYKLIKKDYDLPPIAIYLYKNIPSGAGLGGGSSDAAYMIKLLDKTFKLSLETKIMEKYASSLGADCAFFINNKPVFATGIGDIFHPIEFALDDLNIVVIKPDIFVSTREAFSQIAPKYPQKSLVEIIKHPIEQWKELMVNDFEKTVFQYHPQIAHIKNLLYDKGALYASMSGSGSAVYGIFHEENISINKEDFRDCFVWQGKLSATVN